MRGQLNATLHQMDFIMRRNALKIKKSCYISRHDPLRVRAEDVSPDIIGLQVIAALRQMAPELEEGALLTVDPNRTRLRILPLQPRG